MPLGPCLEPWEIENITNGRVRRDAQAKALKSMGITYSLRGDGSIVVWRATLPGGAASPEAEKEEVEPDWGAMNGQKAKRGKRGAAETVDP